MKTKIFDKSFLLFLAVGISNTLLSAVIMFALEGLGYWLSTAIAYISGAVLSFFLNKKYTFKNNDGLLKTALKFTVSIAVCYILAYSIAQPLANKLLMNFEFSVIWQERITKLFGMGLYTLLNYFGQKFFAFHSIGRN